MDRDRLNEKNRELCMLLAECTELEKRLEKIKAEAREAYEEINGKLDE